MATAELISAERKRLGLTQAELAARASTSRPRINSYEAGKVSPTADTLERIVGALGLELTTQPQLTYEERRSLAISSAVAAKLAERPDIVLRKARHNLERMRTASTHEHVWLDLWDGLLALGPAYVGSMLTSTDQFARDLRQSSPFAGVLSDEERSAAVAHLRR